MWINYPVQPVRTITSWLKIFDLSIFLEKLQSSSINLGGTKMTEKQYFDYKQKYLRDLKQAYRKFMEDFIADDHNHDYDKKLNELVMTMINDDFERANKRDYQQDYYTKLIKKGKNKSDYQRKHNKCK